MNFIPTREYIDNLKIGDTAPNCFGKYGTVKEITYRGTDTHGKHYVGYYVTWNSSTGSLISESLKEGERLWSIQDNYTEVCNNDKQSIKLHRYE